MGALREVKPSVHRQYAQQRVRYGSPFLEAIDEELELSGDCRVVLVVSARQATTSATALLRQRLGNRLAGEIDGIAPHVPRDGVLRGAAIARASRPDCLIAFGGGSVIDATKGILACVESGVEDEADLDALLSRSPAQIDPSDWDYLPATRIVAVPTTLSAAECSYFGGVTDPASGKKAAVSGAGLMPRSVVYDPVLTLGVPLQVFLASGIKAVDHAAERLGSLTALPYSDALSEKALELLSSALPRVKVNPGDLDARLECQMGAWLSMAGRQAGASVGASHALGHVIGGATRALHGDISCVCLAPVLRWNEAAAAERQLAVSRGLGASGESAADAVELLVRALGLPTRLRDIGVDRSLLPALAARALKDPPMRTNPRRPRDVDEIEALLQAMW